MRAWGLCSLRDLTWLEAETVLGPDAIVVLPIGAAAKEHGPHLRLDNDERLADGYARLLARGRRRRHRADAHVSLLSRVRGVPRLDQLRLETARDLTLDVVRHREARSTSVLRAEYRRLDRARAPARRRGAREEGIVFRYTDVLDALGPIEREIAEQEGGTHADEIETSIMLVLAPDRVDMTKAVKDYAPEGTGGLTRNPRGRVRSRRPARGAIPRWPRARRAARSSRRSELRRRRIAVLDMLPMPL